MKGHHDRDTIAVGRIQKQMGIPNFGLLVGIFVEWGWGSDGLDRIGKDNKKIHQGGLVLFFRHFMHACE